MTVFANSEQFDAYEVGKWLGEVMLSAIPTALIYTLIFFAISIVLIFVCQKYKIYTRSLSTWNVLTKLHYIVLVVTFMGLGFGLGLISSIQKAGNRVLDEKLHPSLTSMVPPLQEKILESLPPELAEKSMTGEEIYNLVVERLAAKRDTEEHQADGWIAEVGHEVELYVRIFVVKALIDRAIVKAAEKAGISEKDAKFSIETFKSIDFSEQADEIATKVTKTAKVHVAGFANGFRIQLVICAFIIFGLMAIDPLIYYLAWLPRQRKKAAAEEAKEPAAVI